MFLLEDNSQISTNRYLKLKKVWSKPEIANRPQVCRFFSLILSPCSPFSIFPRFLSTLSPNCKNFFTIRKI